MCVCYKQMSVPVIIIVMIIDETFSSRAYLLFAHHYICDFLCIENVCVCCIYSDGLSCYQKETVFLRITMVYGANFRHCRLNVYGGLANYCLTSGV